MRPVPPRRSGPEKGLRPPASTAVSTSLFAVLLFGIHQRHHAARIDSTNGDFIGIARQYLHFHRVIAAFAPQINYRFAVAREDGFGGNADGSGNAANFYIHATVHARPQSRIRLLDL